MLIVTWSGEWLINLSNRKIYFISKSLAEVDVLSNVLPVVWLSWDELLTALRDPIRNNTIVAAEKEQDRRLINQRNFSFILQFYISTTRRSQSNIKVICVLVQHKQGRDESLALMWLESDMCEFVCRAFRVLQRNLVAVVFCQANLKVKHQIT